VPRCSCMRAAAVLHQAAAFLLRCLYALSSLKELLSVPPCLTHAILDSSLGLQANLFSCGLKTPSRCACRDIKLENIFIDDAGKLKLGDFGLTMSMKQESAISPVGTVEYMAPEVCLLAQQQEKEAFWDGGPLPLLIL
jgi:serine/threonine protein kinase